MSRDFAALVPTGAVAVVALVAVVGWIVTGVLLWRASRARTAAVAEAERLRAEAERARTPTPAALGMAERAVKAAVTTVVRVRDQGVGGLLVSSMEELARWALEDRAEIAKVSAPDGTVTVLFSDVEDSTALNEELGDTAWVRLLGAHDAIVERAVDDHGGHIVKSQGDGFMVVFGDPGDAVGAAAAIQRALTDRPGRRLRRTPIRVRIGMHAGATIARDGDYFGRNVALAARVAGHAAGGQVLVTEPVREALDAQTPVSDIGSVELKGLAGTHRLYSVAWDRL